MGSVDNDLLQIVTLGSAQSRYGGPWDVSIRQGTVAMRAGLRVAVLAGHIPGDRPDVEAGIFDAIVPVRRIVPTPGFTGLFSARFFAESVRQIRRSQVLHISLARELVPIASLALGVIFRKTVIIQSHGMLTSRSSAFHKVVDKLMRPMMRQCRACVALTHDEEVRLRAIYGSALPPVTVLPNPLPVVGTHEPLPAALEPVASGAVVWIARLHKRKRVEDFLTAARAMSGSRPDLAFVVAGPDEGELKFVVDEMDNGTGVTYAGTLTPAQVTTLLSKCGVFVLTSVREPWGNVLAQAIAMGKPVVVPESAALSGAILRYGVGAVYEDENIHDLCEKIVAMIEGGSEPSASLRFQNEMLNSIESELLSLYDEMLAL